VDDRLIVRHHPPRRTRRGPHDPVTTSTGNLLYKQLEGYNAFIGDDVLFPAAPGDALAVLPKGPVHDAVSAYLSAMKAAGFRPDQGNTLSWDAAQLVVDAYKKFGFEMTAAQLRDYLANLRGWTGINGTYDFRAVPQRGLGSNWVIVVRWDKTKDDWTAVSAPGGMPLR
jgi:branched-chain amino acid transport system substrate-binding protein